MQCNGAITITKSQGRLINQYKRLRTPQMDDGARSRRTNRAGDLAEKYKKNPWKVERTAFQDESDFPLQILGNRQND